MIPYLPQTYQYLRQCTTPPSAGWASALNNFINKLIIDGNWSLLDRLWIFAADNQQNARISIVNPTSTAITEVNSPTWTKDVGYTGDGSSKYLNTNYNPFSNGVNYTTNSASMGIYTQTSLAGASEVDMGCFVSSVSQATLALRFTTLGKLWTMNYTAQNVTANTTTTGLNAIARTSSGSESLYQNGTSIATASTTATSVPNLPFFVAAWNEGDSQLYSANTFSMAFAGSGSINQLNFYNSFTTFRTAVGF